MTLTFKSVTNKHGGKNMFDFIHMLFTGIILVLVAAVSAVAVGALALIAFGQIKRARSEKVFAPIAALLGQLILLFGLVGFPWIAAWVLPETRWGVAIGLTSWMSILFLGAGLIVCEEELIAMNKKWKAKNAKRRHPSYK